MERTYQARVSKSANDLIIFIFLDYNIIELIFILKIEVINFKGCFF